MVENECPPRRLIFCIFPCCCAVAKSYFVAILFSILCSKPHAGLGWPIRAKRFACFARIALFRAKCVARPKKAFVRETLRKEVGIIKPGFLAQGFAPVKHVRESLRSVRIKGAWRPHTVVYSHARTKQCERGKVSILSACHCQWVLLSMLLQLS